MMKRHIVIVIGLIASLALQAQERNQYLSFNTGGGLHKLNYTLQYGDVKSGFGGTFNCGYSYFFNSQWGVATGLGITTAGSAGILNYTSAYDAIDSDGDPFELRTKYESWEEKQRSLFLEIPIGINYQRWMNERNGFMVTAGAKVSVPVSASYRVTSGSIITTGYYEQWNVEFSDMPQHGFTTYTSRPSDKLVFSTSYSLYAEAGWLRNVSEKLDVYAGVYLSYGVNDLRCEAGNSVYVPDYAYNSMVTSSLTGKVNLVTAGVKVGLRMHLKSSKKVEPVYAEPVAVVEEKPAEPAPVVPEPVVEEKPAPVPVAVAEPVISIVDTVAKAQSVADQIQIKFPFDSDEPLNDEYDNQFKELASILKANPSVKVIITGHTCDLAGRDYNLKVGLKRAEVGKAKLTAYGVPESQIITESKAFDEPLVPNTSKANRAQNRRIEIAVVKP